ncbi:MAG TPA: DNA translocase FtsK [Candidatus Paceibacterota bacterium]|nr:DNA translocase FtsK [Candidatus Paceibacterota bacterium]
MAKSKKSKARDNDRFGLKDETLQGVIAIAALVVAIFTLLARFGKGGYVGTLFYQGLYKFLGIGYYLLPLICVLLCIAFFKSIHQKFDWLKFIGSLLFLLSGLGLIDIAYAGKAGLVGTWVAYPFLKLFAPVASSVFLSALLLISLLIIFNTSIPFDMLTDIFKKDEDEKADDEPEEKEIKINGAPEEIKPRKEKIAEMKEEEKLHLKKEEKTIKIAAGDTEASGFIKTKPRLTDRAYTSPPLSLLERDSGTPGAGDVKANANIIKRTLANFGIDVEMDEVTIGPSVTRYALKPAEGVKLSKIVALQNDLSLALAAHPLRIEAPIPGKSLVGIEMPNTSKTLVGLGTLLGSDEFQTSEKPLLVSIGRGISGKSHFANVAKMPHALIAGTTGSGKSVAIHTLIVSLLYRNSPEQLRFIMVDPKRVELTLYNGIPHLLTPVITDSKKAILALKWAAKEMDRRYDILEANKVRDIDSYHKTIVNAYKASPSKDKDDAASPEAMPYIVIFIDELADIMTTYPRELEAGIVRLAQMSRAVGIHLLLSTQRPSVNVITGIIKANVPTRMAFQVASQVDSRTILDMSGAEKLLGAGDMLYLSAEISKPQRIQSAYISESEVKKVVKFLVANHADDVPNELNLTDQAVADKNALFSSSFDDAGDSIGEDDDLYEDAKQIVLEAGKGSTSYIQRKLRVGYSRAARLMDLLEKRGVIGPEDGAKPRLVISGSESKSEIPAATEETEIPTE